MAKQTILKERGTGEELYPHTLAKFVKTTNGENVESTINSKLDKSVWDDAHKQFGLIGYYMVNDKVYSPSTSYRFSGKLPLNHNYDIIARLSAAGAAAAISFFSADGTCISAFQIDSNNEVTISKDNFPDNAVFVGYSTVYTKTEESYYSNGPTQESREGAVSEAIQASKLNLFVDMFNSAAGKWGKYDPVNAPDAQHPFYLNELWLTYEEAVNIMEKNVWRFGCIPSNDAFNSTATRTNLFAMNLIDHSDRSRLADYCLDFRFIARGNPTLETLRVSTDDNEAVLNGEYAYGAFVGNIDNMFHGNFLNFKQILGVIRLQNISTPWRLSTGQMPELTTILLTAIKCDFNIACAPKLLLASINFWINNALNSSAITVTVHPDVYAKLTDESNTEWHALLAQAAEKNITFATT